MFRCVDFYMICMSCRLYLSATSATHFYFDNEVAANKTLFKQYLSDLSLFKKRSLHMGLSSSDSKQFIGCLPSSRMTQQVEINIVV